MRRIECMQLIKIRNGDQFQLEQLIHKMYPKIHSYLLRRLRNPTLAKDFTQETFLKFMNHFYELPNDTKIEAYLYRIAYHLCIDYYRICNREVEEIEGISHEKLPIEIVLKKESGERIQKAIAALCEEQQDVIILRYYQELKIKEIAIILNENENTIKTRLQRGTRKLKEILERDD